MLLLLLSGTGEIIPEAVEPVGYLDNVINSGELGVSVNSTITDSDVNDGTLS